MNEDEVTRRIVVRGRVQGVGFRYAMVQQAGKLALRGWVRNRRDGTVEAVIQGPVEPVQELVEWARHGPAGARVDGIEVKDEHAGDLGPFATRPTA
jgi:acylphosphatase